MRFTSVVRWAAYFYSACCAGPVIVGCGADVTRSAPDGGPANDDPSATLHWAPCEDVPVPSGDPSWRPVECAQMPVALDWSAPLGPAISYNIRRIRARRPSRGQIWMIEGGPGISGIGLVDTAERFVVKGLPDLDVYIPDHRGTGRSHFIDCPNGELLPSCLGKLPEDNLKDLPFFNTTQAARDLGQAIDALREPGRQVFVYGVSYGTFLVNRYLNLYPDQATAVVMDGVAQPKGVRMVDYDGDGNRVARDFFDQCAQDPFCAGKLGADPWGALGRLYAALDAGHCPALAARGITTSRIKSSFRKILSGAGQQADARKLIPAFVYRINRCNPSDVAVVEHAITSPPPDPSGASQSGSSSVLAANVWLSEGWLAPPLPSLHRMQAEEAGYYVTNDASAVALQMQEGWTLPLYPDDPSLYRWAPTDIPVLLLDGTLDIETPLFLLDDARAHFSKPHQQLVAVHNSGHETIWGTAVPPSPGQEAYESCGFQMIAHFFQDPTAPLDTRCADVPPIDFSAGLAAPSRAYFGMDDPYDGER